MVERLSARLLPVSTIGAVLMVIVMWANAAAASGFVRVASPNGNADGVNRLYNVSAVTSSNAWAAGEYTAGTATRTLVEHYNGTSWQVFASPNPDGADGTNHLFNITMRTATDGWAVGRTGPDATSRTLILRWNGTTWTKVPSPNPGGVNGYSTLSAVSALSASNAWAVGRYESSAGGAVSLVLHWNGSTWSKQASPNPDGLSGVNRLQGVVALTPSNVWAVGWYGGSVSGGLVYNSRTLMVHWNGTTWVQTASFNEGVSVLNDVAMLSATDGWAFGSWSADGLVRPLPLHWDGVHWSKVFAPTTSSGTLAGYRIAQLNVSNAWAVGSYVDGTGKTRTYALDWDGTSWKRAATTNVGSDPNSLLGVDIQPNGIAWAVGESSSGSTSKTLIERCC